MSNTSSQATEAACHMKIIFFSKTFHFQGVLSNEICYQVYNETEMQSISTSKDSLTAASMKRQMKSRKY